MKTIVKQLATGIFLTILLMVGYNNANATGLNALKPEIIETPAQLENWMTDEAIWAGETANSIYFVQETETKLELEDWMTRNIVWDFRITFVTETETQLKLEDWMTNDCLWTFQQTAMEEKLEMENWMTDSKIWS